MRQAADRGVWSPSVPACSAAAGALSTRSPSHGAVTSIRGPVPPPALVERAVRGALHDQRRFYELQELNATAPMTEAARGHLG